MLIRADGAARGNPGPAAAGAVIIDASRADARSPDAPALAAIARPLGVQTNNYAEYMAVLLALERALELGVEEVELVLDSKLVVEQLSGRWKVRHPQIAPLHRRASELLTRFRRWTARHEPRAANTAADALANLALDDPVGAALAERSAGGDGSAEASGRQGNGAPPPMAGLSWAELADASPELAGAGERLFGAFTVGYLATLGVDGSPRLHPISLTLHGGGLYVFVLARSRRRPDLLRDPRYALHSFPHPPDEDSWNDEAFEIEGRARHVPDAAERDRIRAVHNDTAADDDELFELRIERVHWRSRTAGRASIRRWPLAT